MHLKRHQSVTRGAISAIFVLQGTSTLVQDLFRGQYVSQLKAQGAPQSDTQQPFTLLTLDILPDKVLTLADAITRFTQANSLEGGDLFTSFPLHCTVSSSTRGTPQWLVRVV